MSALTEEFGATLGCDCEVSFHLLLVDMGRESRPPAHNRAVCRSTI